LPVLTRGCSANRRATETGSGPLTTTPPVDGRWLPTATTILSLIWTQHPDAVPARRLSMRPSSLLQQPATANRPLNVVQCIVLSSVAVAKERLTLARQGVYATAPNLACQWWKNSWQCAWGCVAMRVRWGSACHDENFEMFKILFPRCHDLSRRNCQVHVRDIGCHAFRELFVTYARQMARHGVNYASPCRLGGLRAAKMARLGTP